MNRGIWLIAAALLTAPAHGEGLAQAVKDALANVGAEPAELSGFAPPPANAAPVVQPVADGTVATNAALPVTDAEIAGDWHQIGDRIYNRDVHLSAKWGILGWSRDLVELGIGSAERGSYRISGSTLKFLFKDGTVDACARVSADRLECRSSSGDQIVYVRGAAEYSRGGAFDTGGPAKRAEPAGHGGSL